MTSLLNNITQPEYDRISMEYFEVVGSEGSEQFLKFFGYIQSKLEEILKKKFKKEGINMIRDLKEENESTMTFDKPAMRYKLVSIEDKTKTSLHPRLLNLSSILQEIRLVDPKMSQVVPDVKIVVPEYLNAKIDEITQAVVERFKFLFEERLKEINEKLTKEGLNYGQNSFASVRSDKSIESE